MNNNNGVYLPTNIVLGRFLFFAVDNIDFAEDTPDGKNTLHGTAMAIYQQRLDGDFVYPREVSTNPSHETLPELPKTFTDLIPCNYSNNPKPPIPEHPHFEFIAEKEPTKYKKVTLYGFSAKHWVSLMYWLISQIIRNFKGGCTRTPASRLLKTYT